MIKRGSGGKFSGFVPVLVLTGLILVACSALSGGASSLTGKSGDAIDVPNGEMIYFTASSKRVSRIRHRGGPNFGGMMMGSYLTCASCHGPEAHGGIHTMHMLVMDAPDIRYVSLNSEGDEHEGKAHTGEDAGEYDLDDFRLAVTEGKHPDGESLRGEMPRWQIKDEDLADLFAFLKSIE